MNLKKKTPKYSFNKNLEFSKIVKKGFFVSLNTLRIYHCFHYLDFHRKFCSTVDMA